MLDTVLLAMVTLLGGMLFPLRKSMPELSFQLSLLPLTALYLALVLAWFGAGSKRASGLFARLHDMPLSPRFSMAVIAFFLVLSTGMTVYEGRLFSSMGYSMSPAGAVLLLASLLAVVAVLGFSSGGRHLGWSVLVSLAAIQLVSIRNFPLDPARSDMLPLIEAACKRLLSGLDPYSEYVIHDWLRLTYLPGLWLTYMPAVLLGIDPRFVNLLCLASAFLVFRHSALTAGREAVVPALGAVFFLNPWLAFRHDVYLPVVILQIALFSAAVLQGRVRLANAVFAWALCTYQFLWVAFPFYLALQYRRYGSRAVLGTLAWAAGGVLLLVGPFLAWSAQQFYFGVIRSWRGAFNVETINLSYWILGIVPLRLVKAVQAGLLLVFCALTLRRIVSGRSFLAAATAATILVILTNQLIWHYFFIIPPLYLLFHAVAPAPDRAGGSLPGRTDPCCLMTGD
ncbi:hypothetical protein GX411_10015 [Candidatus Fermentibacteria bacterium]|nr:hypothetical protein [Candidatus Fermentibacteria bacterium]